MIYFYLQYMYSYCTVCIYYKKSSSMFIASDLDPETVLNVRSGSGLNQYFKDTNKAN
jgi:hypothetical protein